MTIGKEPLVFHSLMLYVVLPYWVWVVEVIPIDTCFAQGFDVVFSVFFTGYDVNNEVTLS